MSKNINKWNKIIEKTKILQQLLTIDETRNKIENKNLVRFLLTFFLGWIGSIIINRTEIKLEGHTCRTVAYFFLTIVTFGIYALVVLICNLSFDSAKEYWLF
jgi:hypothetical protein